jgi:NAD(P)H-dependent flavin oxidoreductase YrpB (nitropropane dioxygenase family)
MSDPDITPSMHTPLCDLLGIEYPILSVGFSPMAARAELVSAVSNAGGFGVLAQIVDPDGIRVEADRTRRLTDRPFGFNIIIARGEEEDFRVQVIAMIAAAAGASATAVVLFWGDPAPYVKPAHDAGAKVLIQVGSVDEAEAAAEAGVDAIIAQGIEAGGHVRGSTSIWELLPAVAARVAPLPVLAAGGIGDGAGLGRALGLGAAGVSLGTRFVASDEANIHIDYKRRVVAATAADTVYTPDLYYVGWPGAPHRSLRNKTYAEWEAAGRPPIGSRPGEGESIGRRGLSSGDVVEWPRYSVGIANSDFKGDVEYSPLWAGESCSVVNDIKPAAQIVADLVREARG